MMPYTNKMLRISEKDICARLNRDNPWWNPAQELPERSLLTRSYFSKFYALIKNTDIQRATILMGPRRVGKTVMIYQSIIKLIDDSVISSDHLLFVSIDTPVYVGLSLEKLLNLFFKEKEIDENAKCFVFFDEVQYLKNWEVHLKDLVDRYPNVKFTASGSAAAALKLQSVESGAGRFTDFMLPPLTFAEFIHFSGQDNLIIKHEDSPVKDTTTDISSLNKAFIEYINFGGYPEVVMNKEIRADSNRFIKQDIIDKVLLRDLPSLYGIADIQELNSLFTVIAYHTGNELSFEKLSQDCEIGKEKIKKYLEYLEAAFLIVTVTKVNETAKHFKRKRQFKVYLTNPSMRAALFSKVSEEDDAIGALTETAIFSQWFHSPEMSSIHYARWKTGEVDLVKIDSLLKPAWAYEIKWSNRFFEKPHELKSLMTFAKKNDLDTVGCSTKTESGKKTIGNIEITFFPASLHCYQVGRRVDQDTT